MTFTDRIDVNPRVMLGATIFARAWRVFPMGECVVLYRIDGDDVLIQRVVRGSRDLEALLRE